MYLLRSLIPIDILHPVNGVDSWIQAGEASIEVLLSISNS